MDELLKQIPFEILELIFIDLSYIDLLSIQRTNKHLQHFINISPQLFHWKLALCSFSFSYRPMVSELKYLLKNHYGSAFGFR